MLIVLPEIKDNSLILFAKTLADAVIDPLNYNKMDLNCEDPRLLNLILLNFFIKNNISSISIDDIDISENKLLINVINTSCRLIQTKVNALSLLFFASYFIGGSRINSVTLFCYHNNIYVQIK